MDISTYYTEFQSEYKLAVFAVLFALFVVVFCGIRTIRDNKITVATRIFCLLLLTVILATTLYVFIVGTYSLKKDVDQQTIYCYEGVFEIEEISNGIIHFDKVKFLLGNQNISLYCYKSHLKEQLITIGTYEGKIYYAENAGRVLLIELKDFNNKTEDGSMS